MRARTNKNKFFFGALFGFVVFGILLGAALWLTSSPSLAVTVNPNLGPTFGLGTADLESTVIKIIQWALGFLGLVAVIIIMYGGFIWMTAAGNEEKVRKAKKIITQAVIGLVIIMLAWAIVTFIIGRLNGILNGPGQQFCTPGAPNGCYDCNAAGTAYSIFDQTNGPQCVSGDTFHKKWVDPAPNEDNVPLCSIVQVQYNGNFDAGSIAGNVGLYVNLATNGNGAACNAADECRSGVCTANACVGDEVVGTWQVVASNHSFLEFLPNTDYLENTEYRAEIRAGVAEEAPARTTVPYTWTFTTGTTTLTTPPTVTQIYPDDNDTGICLMTPVQAKFSQKMRVSSINSGTVLLQSGAPVLLSTFSFPTVASFSTRPQAPLVPDTDHTVTMIAGTPGGTCSVAGPGCDIKNNCITTCGGTWTYNTDGIMDVCFNHLDGNYSGTDDGSAGGDDFMSINGQPNPGDTTPWSFTTDADTTNTKCVPEITSINPDNGQYSDPAPGAEISGTNFGIIGNVTFNSGVLDQLNCFNGVNWPNQNCNVSWTGNTIQTRIPGGPINYGGIIPSNGAKDGGIVVTITPGVCEGGSNDNGACTVANQAADCPGGKCIEDSNAVGFDVTSPQIGKVSGLDKAPHGGIGQYVTVIKRNDSNAGFGAVQGQVFFRNRLNGAEVVAEFPPDPPCDANWSDTRVIIKVPDLSAIATACVGNWAACVNTDSEVAVQVVKSDGTRSNLAYFIYTNEAAGPGLCKVDPVCGVEGTAVVLSGEKFDGPNPHSVSFALGTNPPVTVAPTSWTDTDVGADVPNLDNAEDPYEVNVSNGNGASNSLPFEVPCGGVPKVVETTACSLHCVGGINDTKSCLNDEFCAPGGGSCIQDTFPSPNPYKNATNVCLNAGFGATFSTLMDHATLSDINIKLYDCTDNTSACATTNDITPPPGNYSASDTATNTSFQFFPVANLTSDHYYKAVISKEVRSTTNVKMVNDYAWTVKTQAGTDLCPVTGVLVTPAKTILAAIDPDPGSTQDYAAVPLGPKCTFMNPNGYTWGWDTLPLGVATVASVLPQPPYNSTATAIAEGTTKVRATTEGKTGQGSLSIILDYCDASTDCTKAGQCPGSICDIPTNRCTPVITDRNGDGQALSPASGPRSPNPAQPGTTVTIEGCYFGSYVVGSSQIQFAGNDSIFFCPKPWTDSQIITSVPDTAPLGNNAVIVRTAVGLTSPGVNFTVTNTCEGGVPVPATGVPGICSISPATGRNLSQTSFNGYQFTSNGAPPVAKAQFTQDGGGYTDSTTGSSDAAGTVFSGATVPDNAVSGPARMAVEVAPNQYCPSNSLTFGVTCSSSDQCGTGCCAYSNLVHAKICQELEACSPGTPGTTCKLDDAEHIAADLCQLGKTVSGTGDYRCIDADSHLTPDSQGTPPVVSGPYPPGASAPCVTCCSMDINGDGSNIPQTNTGGLNCTADIDACSGAGSNRGLYCGCAYDVNNPVPGDTQCDDGSGTLGCGSNTCCYARPQFTGVTPAVPAPPNGLLCLNNIFTFTFDQPMDASSVIPGTSVEMIDSTATNINITVLKTTNGFVIKPAQALTPGLSYTIRLRRDLIRSSKGIAWSATPNDWQAWQWPVDINATICTINSIEWLFIKNPLFSYPAPDYFNCFTDSCTDDMNIGLVGNQHWAFAQALDKYSNPVSANYNWSIGDPTIATVDPAQHTFFNDNLTAQQQNGRTSVNVEAVPDYFTGTKTSSARVTVNACEHPWPNPFPPENDTFPYIDNATHFSISYCRDPGELPLLAPTGDVVVKDGTYLPGNKKNERIKEFFFTRNGTDDAIGILVYENEGNQSPRDWYFSQFGPAAPEPQDLTVDGYPAVRAGTTVYVSAWNAVGANVGDRLYPNIYLISYNEDASDETVAIYNRMISNWEFTINIGLSEKEQMLRDMRRVTDLTAIYAKLMTYRTDKGIFPKLEGGSYVKMLSTSKWPSWQDTLGTAINGNLPKDPIDKFAVPDPLMCTAANHYDQTTCWSDTQKRYECPADSFVYQYMGSADGSMASLFAHLEYLHYLNGGWYIGADPVSDVCNGLSEAECPCFNYEYNVTGSATDHDGPDIIAVDSLVLNQNTTVSGTRALDVTVSDAGSGVNRVLFYIDGILNYTDTDNAVWSWDFNTSQYTDGSHTVRVRAYDNAGNLTDRDYAINIDNSGQPDSTAPFVTITTPQDGTTVSNRNVTYSPDKWITAGGVEGIEASNTGSIFWVNYPVGTSSLNRVDADLTLSTLLNSFNYPNPDLTLNLTPGNRVLYWVGKDRSTGDMLVTYTPDPNVDRRKILRIPAGAAPNTPPTSIYYFTGPGFDWRGFTHAVGAPDGKIIAVIYFHQLAVYNPSTGVIEHFLDTGGQIGGIDTDSAGNIYITRATNPGGVYKYDQNLNLIGSITNATFNLPIGLAVDGQTIYVANQNSHDIVAVDTSLTKVVHVFGEAGVPGNDLAHLSSPQDVTVFGNNLYISDLMNARILRVKTLISYGVQINALATDNRQVSSVNFSIRDVGNNLVDAYSCTGNTTTTLSCSFAPPWDSTQVPNGPYTITALAADNSGHTGSTSVTVNVDNLDPIRPVVTFDQSIPGLCAEGTCQNSGVPCDYLNQCGGGELCVFSVACDQTNTPAVCSNNFNNQMCLRSGSVTIPVSATDNKQVNEVKFYVDGLFMSNGIHQPGTCVTGGQACTSDADCTAPDTCDLDNWSWNWDSQGYSKGVCASHCSVTLGQMCVASSDCPANEVCVAANGIGLECNADSECNPGLTCPGHQVVAYAYDDARNIGTDTMFIPVDVAQDDAEPPTVSFIPPTPNEGTSIDNSILVRVQADDNYGVNRVNFYMDHVLRYTALAGQATEWTVDTTSVPDGWHSFQVDALDARGNRSTSIERNYNVRGPGGPLITDPFITPDTGPLGTVYTIYANVTDYDGVDSVVVPIQSPDETDLAPPVLITLGLVSGDNISGLYSGTWTSTVVAALWVDVQARDILGNTSEYENIPGRPACDNNGTCDSPVETNANCPLDCPATYPVITSVLSASGQVGIAFSYQIIATNGPNTFTATNLPNGLTVNAAGLISGTPAVGSNATYTVPLTATNAFGTDTKNLTLVIQGPCVAHSAGPCTGALTGNDNCCLSSDFCNHNGTKTYTADDTCSSKKIPGSPCDYWFWCISDECSFLTKRCL